MSDARLQTGTSKTLRSIMKSKKLSTLIKDALDSPVGSTSRMQAQQVMRLLDKQKVKDGMGGPGFLQIPQINMKALPKVKNYSNLIIFPSAPKMTWGKMDGAGGPAPIFTPLDYTKSPLLQATNYKSPIPTLPTPTSGAMQQPTQPAQPAQQTPQAPQIPQTGNYTDSTGYFHTPGLNGAPLTRPTTPPAVVPPAPPAPGSPIKFSNVQEAVNKGVGPTTFAQSTMVNNPDMLKSYGFSGGTMADRYADNDKVTRQITGLDQLLNQYSTMVNQGVGLQGRLTDYIRGRDEYLNTTDQLLEKHKDRMLTMNMADPLTNASATSYANFLYELRGSQNKRYVEFLDMSLQQYDSSLKAKENQLNIAMDMYTRELTRKDQISQMEYQTMFGALSEMYTQAADAPKQLLEMQIMQEQLYGAHLDNLKAANGANAFQSMQDSYAALKKMDIITSDGRIDPSVSLTDIENWDQQGIADSVNALELVIDASKRNMMMPEKQGDPSPDIQTVSQMGSKLVNMIDYFGQQRYLDPAQVQAYKERIQDNISTAIVSNGIIGPAQETVAKDAVHWLSTANVKWGFGKGVPTLSQFLDKYSGQGLSDTALNSIFQDFEGNGTDGYATVDKRASFEKDLAKTNISQWLASAYAYNLVF